MTVNGSKRHLKRMIFKTSVAMLLAGLVLPGLLTPLPLALAIGEDDPLWQKNTYEKKVSDIGNRLLEANGIKENISFGVIYRRYDEKSNVNAQSNSLYADVKVESGMLKYISSDDEMAFILGHEIGHILHDDSNRRRLGYVASTVLITAPLAVVGAMAGPSGVVMGSWLGHNVSKRAMNIGGQGQEMRADLVGLKLMSEAGYDPKKALNISRKIFSDGSAWKINRSHPMGKERIAQIQEFIQELAMKEEASKMPQLRGKFGEKQSPPLPEMEEREEKLRNAIVESPMMKEDVKQKTTAENPETYKNAVPSPPLIVVKKTTAKADPKSSAKAKDEAKGARQKEKLSPETLADEPEGIGSILNDEDAMNNDVNLLEFEE